MKTKFTPIAMRCTKEQFKAIEPKLKEHNIKNGDVIFDLESYPYLTNFYSGERNSLGSTDTKTHKEKKTEWFETWDEATFLKACGIEVDTYTVSKDFILEAHKDACSTWKTKIENQFPELFSKVELEVGKWYKASNGSLFFLKDKDKDFYKGYGFTKSMTYYDDFREYLRTKCILATKEEVETALIAEAKKRGVWETPIIDTKNKVRKNKLYSDYFDESDNLLWSSYGRVFHDGVWAEIISEPIEISLDEIAEKFGVDVSLIKIKK